MDTASQLTHGAKVVLGAGIAFLVVSFLRWQEVSADLGSIGSIEAGQSMWHGIGVIAGLIAIVLVAWQAVRLANVTVDVGVSPSLITAALALLLVLFTFAKFLVDDEFRTFWAWLGLVLSVAVAVGAWLNLQAAGDAPGGAPENAAATAAEGTGADGRLVAPTPHVPEAGASEGVTDGGSTPAD